MDQFQGSKPTYPSLYPQNITIFNSDKPGFLQQTLLFLMAPEKNQLLYCISSSKELIYVQWNSTKFKNTLIS